MDSSEFGLSPGQLRDAALRVEEVYAAVGYEDGDDLPDSDWRWGLSVFIFVEGYSVGVIKAHPDGYLTLFTKEEKNV